jgi:S1-C subfamily serine protease
VRPFIPLAAALAALIVAGPVAAAPPGNLSADPLDRAALLALPSVYQVTVTIRVDALRLSDGRRIDLTPPARTFERIGTAVAVGDRGWLVTAGHVATPDAPTLATFARQNDLAFRDEQAHADAAAARRWVASTGARAVGPGVVRVTVDQADAGAAVTSFPVLRRVPDRKADLALIRIQAPGAPALGLEEAARSGTPVATIGFGSGPALDRAPRADLEPAIRRGAIALRVSLPDGEPERDVLLISVPVEHGDSGSPVIDAQGRVRGIVVERTREGGVAELATEVRLLLGRAGAAPGPNASADLFRDTMTAFWGLDLEKAGQAAGATLARFPQHTLATRIRGRAAALTAGEYRLSARRGPGLLLATGVLAGLIALACGIALARPALRRARAGGGGR